MKKITTLLLFLSFTLLIYAQKNFEVMTPKPVAGSTITIEYMPRNTVLQGVKDFEATAYLLEGPLPRAIEVPLKQEGGIFRGSVKTADTTRAVFFSFAKDEKQDNNNDEGYFTLLYDKNGKEVAGAQSAIASAYANFGGIWGLKRNATKATEFNQREFANAASKEKFINDYLAYLGQSKVEEDKDVLKTELEKQLQKKTLTETDLQRYKFYFEGFLKDKEKGQAVQTLMKERFPNGAWKRDEALQNFNKANTPEEKEKLYKEFLTAFGPFSKADDNLLDRLASGIANAYATAGNYAAAKTYFAKIKSNGTVSNGLNNLAWKLAGEGINNKPVDVVNGLAFSKQSLDAIGLEKKTLKDKPPYFTEKQYRKSLDNSYNMFADTYATLLYHKGDYAQAYTIEKAAVEGFQRKDVSMNEAFAALTEKTKGPKAAQAELESFLEEGRYTPAMKEQLQRLYLAAGNSGEQWTKYVNNIEEQAYNKLKTELAKTMINMPAPQFALKDMSGKEVALSSLKGKIVVVDFWATWCGPCIASFPGMQMAMKKFKDNKDVVFLFIDTWENDSNRVQKVTDFIAKNKYDFHVLYDDAKAKEGNDFVVVENFKVEGIPTKFVIDRNSNIRFKAVGFNGSADAIVSELTAMIDMADGGSSGPVKKAF